MKGWMEDGPVNAVFFQMYPLNKSTVCQGIC